MHLYYKGKMVLDTINKLISKHYTIITVRTIKAFNDIDKADRSTNNYIWRNLEILEKEGFIKLLGNKPIRIYKLPKEPIILEEVSNVSIG